MELPSRNLSVPCNIVVVHRSIVNLCTPALPRGLKKNKGSRFAESVSFVTV
jgi:hypothetical protein